MIPSSNIFKLFKKLTCYQHYLKGIWLYFYFPNASKITPPPSLSLSLDKRRSYLESAFVIGVTFIPDPVCDRIDNINLQEIGGRSIRIIQGLLLTEIKK